MILMSHWLLMRMLDGLRSRCTMFPLCDQVGAELAYLEIQKAAEELIHDGTDVGFTPIRNALGVAEQAVKVPASVLLAIRN